MKGPAAVEALLFAAAEPLSLEDISRILELTEMEALTCISEVKEGLKGHGIEMNEVAGGYHLVTKPEYAEFVKLLGRPKPPPPLSQAALEVMAIIMYRQPVTRAEIEGIRGVKCETALGTLEERGLIEEVGRKDAVGRPILYAPTERCLRYFGLRSLEDLPELEPLELDGEEVSEGESGNTDRANELP